MSTSVVFETSTLADSLKKAARIAPTRGVAFDQAAGMYFEIRPDEDESVALRVTNTQIFYTEWINCIEAKGDAVDWRIPSAFVTGIITKLPIGTGKTVKLESDGRRITITSGRMKATVGLIDTSYFPVWEPFDLDELHEVEALGARIEQVSWAVSKDMEPMTGIHVDGKTLVATDRYKLVTVPCDVPIVAGSPITVPAAILAPLIRQMGDTKVGIVGNFLVFAPDETTQIKCIIFGQNYPEVSKVMKRDMPNSIFFEKAQVVEIIDRIRSTAGTDRQAALKVFIGNEEIAFFMETDGGTQAIEDALDLEGQAQHPVLELDVSADNLVDGLSKGPNDQVMLYYDKDNPRAFLYVDGGSGYEVWIAPRMLKKAVEVDG